MVRKLMVASGWFVVCVLGLGFIAGCDANVSKSLNRTRWLLVLISGKPPLSDVPVTANFDKAQVAGIAGCNHYSANFTTNGEHISIRDARTTLMACAEPIMAQEQIYLAALAAAAKYLVNGNQLQLKDVNGNPTLEYKKQTTDLSGTSWDVLSYNNGKQAVVSVIIGTRMTAKFAAEGTLSGFAGCNDYTAAYTVNGTAVTITPPSATRKACAEPAGVVDQESAYLAALPTAATYRIEAGKLELRTADGAIVATFAPAQ